MLVEAGDRASADARVVEAAALQVEESALTGESVAVAKTVEPLPDPGLPLGDRHNLIFGGTVVASGRGRALVVATGMETELGGIAGMLQTIERGKTPLQRSLDRVAVLLARAALVLVAVVVGLGLLRGEPFLDMLLFGVALAVAVVPEALPAVITISLTLAAQRMIRRNVLVRRLPAIETLGSVTVIASDKTGTLTKDEMTARTVVVADGAYEVSGTGYEPDGAFLREGEEVDPSPALLETLRAATLASDATLARDGDDDRWRIRGDATEGALVVAAAKAGLRRSELEAVAPRVGEIPFTSESKRMATLHEGREGTVAYVKGAPEVVLDACVRQLADDGERPLGDDTREALLATARTLAGDALRVLAVARRTDATLDDAERDLTFLGLVGMIDPPRDEVRDAVQTCLTAGVRPVMITGDHPLTAQAIARELGILTDGRTITGAELEELDDDALAGEVESIQVYARVSPAHKLRVVQALQAQRPLGRDDRRRGQRRAGAEAGRHRRRDGHHRHRRDEGSGRDDPDRRQLHVDRGRGRGGPRRVREHQEVPHVPALGEPRRDRAARRRGAAREAAAAERGADPLRQPRDRRPARAGAVRRPAGGRPDAPSAAAEGRGHLHAAGRGADPHRRRLVGARDAHALLLGAHDRPVDGGGDDAGLRDARPDRVLQGVQLPLRPPLDRAAARSRTGGSTSRSPGRSSCSCSS